MQHCTATMSICFLMTRRRRCRERPHHAAVDSSVKFNFRRPVSCTRASASDRERRSSSRRPTSSSAFPALSSAAHIFTLMETNLETKPLVFFFSLSAAGCARADLKYTTCSMEKRSLESSETWRNTRNCSRLKSIFFPLLHAYEGSLLCSRCVLFFFLQFILLPQLRESRCFASAPRTNDDDEDVELYRSLERNIWASYQSVENTWMKDNNLNVKHRKKLKASKRARTMCVEIWDELAKINFLAYDIVKWYV